MSGPETSNVHITRVTRAKDGTYLISYIRLVDGMKYSDRVGNQTLLREWIDHHVW